MPDRLARLPVNVRPQLGETTDSYIRRLARANHLKPSYLHCFLCGPPFWLGKPQIERLAAVSGRSAKVLQHALSDASSPRGRAKPNPRALRLHQHKALTRLGVDLAVLIQHDALDGRMSIRAISEEWDVPSWLVRRVLTSSIFPERSTRRRRNALDEDAKELVTAMIAKRMGAMEIWTELMDTHNISTSLALLTLQIRDANRRRTAPGQSDQRRQTSGPI
ncbi:hypothetical protein [Streptomyces sp. UNOB3_S3]|uniref:hypothetical protein n=1 Tax=Streptomyces sp. UNOB3_S3 TaxID=2871682 RepID=UPI001E5A38D7|nr:hypothetical protein [Streptomyces sp. UNOB3_S3]MCC3778809.1 hypothetical protein [Streptomyces sp. UNOB3_S3]